MRERLERPERLPVHVPVRIDLDGQWQDATIVNMSEHGMCLRTNAALPMGETINVHRGAQTAQVAVRWSADGMHGAYSGTTLPVFNFINEHPRSRYWMGLPVVERRKNPARWPTWSQRVAAVPQAAMTAAIALIGVVGVGQSVLITLRVPVEAAHSAYVIGL